MVTKWQSTDLWWKAGLETELQPGKIILKGSGKSPLLLVYLFTGLCWLTSREPGAVNLDENVSSLCGILSMALCSNILGTCLHNIVHPCENCWNQPRCICCGCNTCVHPNSDRKVKTQGIICKEKKSWLKLIAGLNCHGCFWDSHVAENFAFWKYMFCWTSLALEIPGSAQ